MQSMRVHTGIHILAFMPVGCRMPGMYPFVVPFFILQGLCEETFRRCCSRVCVLGEGVFLSSDRLKVFWNKWYLLIVALLMISGWILFLHEKGAVKRRRDEILETQAGAELALLAEKIRLQEFGQAFLSLEELYDRQEHRLAFPDRSGDIHLSEDGSYLRNAAEARSGRSYDQRVNFARQLGRIGEGIRSAAPGIGTRSQEIREKETLLRKRFCNAETDVTALWLEKDTSNRYRLYLQCPAGGVPDGNTLAEQAGKALGRRMCCVSERTLPDYGRLVFLVQEGRFRLTTGIARRAGAGEKTCGDQFSVMKADPWNVVLMLSDGMGRGERAGQKSRKLLEHLELMLAAGFDLKLSVEMSNASVSFWSDGLESATLDLAFVDLWGGTAKFVKLGASTTFIRGREGVDFFHSGSLPAGLLEQAEPDVFHRTLQSGDMLVMVSDGILDSLKGGDPERLFAEQIASFHTDNAQTLADYLMEEICRMQSGDPGDDCTVLVAGIWEFV